jgi:brefeldin A-resistance guanine nucleotide exchange factor 1
VQGLKAISFVIINQHVSSENYGACVEFVGALARVEGASQENAVKCCELLAALSAQVNRVKHLEGEITPDDEKDALMFYWIPVLQRLATLSRDKRWEVRNKAITMMQRALLLDHMTAISADGWHILFDQVIFPLVDEVLKAEDASLPKDNIEELRIRASTILCKTLLQYLPKIVQSGDFNTLWLKILRYIEQYMKEKKGVLAEATAESLKNILLVMITSEILRPVAPGQEPQDPSQALWVLTWTTIDRFCPGLDKEIVVKRPQDKPDVAAQSTVPAAPSEPSTDAQTLTEPSTDAQTPSSTEPSTTVNIPSEADSNSLV